MSTTARGTSGRVQKPLGTQLTSVPEFWEDLFASVACGSIYS